MYCRDFKYCITYFAGSWTGTLDLKFWVTIDLEWLLRLPWRCSFESFTPFFVYKYNYIILYNASQSEGNLPEGHDPLDKKSYQLEINKQLCCISLIDGKVITNDSPNCPYL